MHRLNAVLPIPGTALRSVRCDGPSLLVYQGDRRATCTSMSRTRTPTMREREKRKHTMHAALSSIQRGTKNATMKKKFGYGESNPELPRERRQC